MILSVWTIVAVSIPEALSRLWYLVGAAFFMAGFVIAWRIL